MNISKVLSVDMLIKGLIGFFLGIIYLVITTIQSLNGSSSREVNVAQNIVNAILSEDTNLNFLKIENKDQAISDIFYLTNHNSYKILSSCICTKEDNKIIENIKEVCIINYHTKKGILMHINSQNLDIVYVSKISDCEK